jgi:peptidoglycan/LPS O-acetylase OafA/YrhL
MLVLVGLAGKATAAWVVPPGPWGGWGADWHTVIERSFFGHADMFGFGMMVAVLHVLREDGRLRLPRRWRLGALGLMLAVALPTTKLLHTELDARGDPVWNYPYDFVMAAVGAVFLAWIVLPDPSSPRPWLAVRLLEQRTVVAIGVVSYSLFLWHEPLILLLREHGLTGSGPSGFAVNLAVVTIVALLLSILTYHYFERPALIRKSRSSGGLSQTPRREGAELPDPIH